MLHAGSGAVNAGLSLGRSIGISANLTNNAGSPQPFYYVVQVLDVDSGGTVISLSWVSGVLPGGQSVSAGIDWNPTKAGQYRAETFVLDDIDRPTPLSQKQSITFTVSNN
jgi:hypothetical protein